MVFYEGSRNWTAPLNFKEKVEVEVDFESYVPNFEYHLFSVKDVNFEELERVVNALSVIIGMEAKRNFEDAVEWLKGIFDKLPLEEKELLRKYARILVRGLVKGIGMEDAEKMVEEALSEEGITMFEILAEDLRRKLRIAKEAERKLKEAEEKVKKAEEKAKKVEEKLREKEEEVRRLKESRREFLLRAVRVIVSVKFGEAAKDYLDEISKLEDEDLERLVSDIQNMSFEDFKRMFER